MITATEKHPLLGNESAVESAAVRRDYPTLLDLKNAKTYAAGLIDGDEYGGLSGFGTVETGKCSPTTLLRHIPAERQKRVIIVGAGISGIQQATILLRDGVVKLDEMVIFDTQDGYGGVWNKNKYPGCACDVPSMIYSTSYFMNKKLTNFFATQPQINRYYADFAQQYQLHKCTRFKSFVRSCHWDNDIFKWRVTVQNSSETQEWLADFVCQCVGTLDRPKFGTTPGRDKYRGVSWHTAHWRQDYDLTGKKVAIIGCGPSAAQVIPEIVDKVKNLTVYIRNPPTCVPRNDFQYSRFFRWACVWIPFFAYFVRQGMVFGLRHNRKVAIEDTSENAAMSRAAEQFLEKEVKDPDMCEILRPRSKFVREHIIEYTERGVISENVANHKQAERAYDAIIFGTGFNVAQYLEHEEIVGLNGANLQEQWKLHPEALYGLAVSNFPNMFLSSGPNTASVWSSQHDNWILQAKFVGKAIRALDRRARQEPGTRTRFAMYPTKKAERDYNEALQSEQQQFVWANSSCTSYYKNDAGWITFTMPWTYWQFWWMLRRIDWEQWEIISNK